MRHWHEAKAMEMDIPARRMGCFIPNSSVMGVEMTDMAGALPGFVIAKKRTNCNLVTSKSGRDLNSFAHVACGS